MTDYLIKHATIVTMNPEKEILHDGAIAIAKDRIAELGTTDVLEEKYMDAAVIIEAGGKIVFPGLINTHVHSFQNLLKGLESDSTLEHWLARVISPSVAAIQGEELYAGAVLSALEAVRSGTTTVLDYQYVQHQDGLNDWAIRGYRDVGLRLFCGRGYADTGLEFGANPEELETLDEIRHRVTDLCRRYPQEEGALVRIALAPSAVWMCSPECLRWTSEFARENGLLVTAHIAETPYDNQCSRTLHGYGDFEACEKYGLIGKNMLMVHCVQLTREEVERAAKENASYSYNPVSNMYLASGCPPVAWFKQEGLNGSLGTDGAASNNTNDLLETLKAGILLAKADSRDPGILSATEALAMATCDGARALGMDAEIGSLEPGKQADLFILDPARSARSAPCHDPVATLAYSADSRSVEMVMVAGRPVLWDGELLTGNEQEWIQDGIRAGKQLAERMNRNQETDS